MGYTAEVQCQMVNMPRYTGVLKQPVPAWNNTKYAAVRGEKAYDCVVMNYFDYYSKACNASLYGQVICDYSFSQSLRMMHNCLKEQ